MVDWTDPAVIAKCAAVFANIVHISAGAYALDVFFTSEYDWDIITGKRRWKWTMPLYFFGKWIMFFSVIAMLLVLNIDTPINCQALYSFAQFAGNSAIGSASTLLMLRTVAIWNRNLFVTVPLVILSVGQWAILFHGMTTVRSAFYPDAHTCILTSTGDTNNLFLNLLYLYTMFVDLIVLVLSTAGLLMTPGRSSLWKLLFKDGVVFFLIAFFSNTGAAVMLLLNLNPAMNLIFSVPAACITASAASRSFIRLSTWAQADVFVHQSAAGGGARGGVKSVHNPQVSMTAWTRPAKSSDLEAGHEYETRLDAGADLDDFESKPNTRTVNFVRPPQPGQTGVMITMDTFSHVNDETKRSKRSKSSGSSSSLEFDSTTPGPGRARPGEPNDAHPYSYGDGVPTAAARF